MMNDLLTWAAGIIDTLNPSAILLIMVVVAYLENVIPPLPGDVVVVFGGYLAAEGRIDPVTLLLLTTLAATAGFMTYFYLGWRWGSEEAIAARHKYLSRFIDTSHIDRALSYMRRYGEWVILANRFLAGTRSIISISAGMSRMNWWQTAGNAALSALLWNTVLIAAGWQLRTNWEVFGQYLKTYGQVVLGLLVLVFVIRYFYRKNRSSTENHTPTT